MKKRYLLTFIAFFGIVSMSLAIAQPAGAAVLDGGAKSQFRESVKQTGGPAKDDLASKIKSAVDLLLYLAGTVAVIVIIIAGIRFVTSDGDPGKADKARNTVIYAAIGLVIAVAAFAIVNFVLDRFA